MTEKGLRFTILPYCFVLFALLFINSCKPEFNITAPYKPISVVYGLLDPADSIQYIKINKAFLGNGNALVMAQQKDSVNYAPGALNVQLQHTSAITGNSTIIQLSDTTGIPKDPGLFSNPYQLLYYTNSPILNDGNPYNLVIYNNSDQQSITSSTPIVGAINTNDISPSAGEPIDFTGALIPTYNVSFTSVTNATLYNLIIRFYYTETNTSTATTTDKYVDWNLGTQLAQHLNDGETISFDFPATGFYSFLAGQLSASSNLKRTISGNPLDFMIYFAGDNLNTYIQVNQPSIGIVQDVPIYTNINGGVGIFSTRSSVSLFRAFTPNSIDSLQEGRYTKGLNFQ